MISYIKCSDSFDSLYDTGMVLAKFFTQIWHDSEHFTLQNYPDKDKFYSMIKEKITSFSERVTTLKVWTLDIIDTFHLLVNKSRLSLRRAYRILWFLLLLIDISDGVIPRPHNLHDIFYQIIKDTGKVKYEETTIAPLINGTGIFGFNTYLYGYYHGIHLVSCSITPVKTHGIHVTGLQNMNHDLEHENRVKKSLRRHSKFQELYRQAFTLDQKNCKLLIHSLFLTIHETDFSGKVLTKTDNVGKFLDKNFSEEVSYHGIEEHYPALIPLGYDPSLSKNIVVDSIVDSLELH